MTKKIISVNVDVDAWIAAKSKVDNLSAYLNDCIMALNGKTETDVSYDNLKAQLLECQNIIKEATIKQSIIQQSMKEIEANKALKAEEEANKAQYERWKCPVCHTLNFLEFDRCQKCNLPTKKDPKTEFINIKEATQ